MSYISSINFKKSTSFQVFHNANIRPSYAIGGKIECTLKGYEAEALKNELIAEAKKTYETTVKQKFQAKSYEWSAVCNIKPETTMQDLENLAKHFNEKYGFQCYQIAIHRDEGHIEGDKKIINHHAHLEFITLDKETGKNVYSRAHITPSKLRQMQTEVAEILQMERGVDKRISGAKRVEPRLFAKMKEEERKNQEALKLEIAQNKKDLESTNKLLEKEQQKTKDLTTENNELKSESNELKSKLTTEIESFKGKNEALKTQVKDLKSANELLEKSKNAQNTQITTLQKDLKQEKEKNKKTLEELEKLRKESKNKGLPKEYFQGINKLKKLLIIEWNGIEFDKNYKSFQNQWKDYNKVTKEIFEDLIYINNINIDFDDKIFDLEEEIESLQQKNKDLTASNNELKEKIATKEADEKNRNAEVEKQLKLEIERLKKEKEEQELKTKNELSNLRLELEKEQQKSKDLTTENNELKKESNENHLTNIGSQLEIVKAMREQQKSKDLKIEIGNEAELMYLQEKVLKLDRNELKNEKWIIALAYCEQEIAHHGYVVDAIPDMVKYQKEAWKNKDSIKQDYLDKAKKAINNSIDRWKKTIASNAKTIVRQR